MRKLSLTLAAILATLTISLLAMPSAFAACDLQCTGCRNTIKVVPVGAVETGDPIVTVYPAKMMIFHTGNGPIKNVWLLIVLNEPTYNALNKITINGTAFMTKADFELVTTKKIPPALPNPAKGYPGSLCDYEVSAVKDKLDAKGEPVYYGVKFFLDKITKSPTYFTLSLEFDSSVSDVKALILALGRYDNCKGLVGPECICPKPCLQPFNACSSFSKSTLIVPEAATLAIAAAPLGALGLLYTFRRRRK